MQRKSKTLFIDARNLGFLKSRKNRELSNDDIALIASTYHNWRKSDADYQEVQGFCKCATIEEIRNLNYALTPGRYIGLPDDEDDFNFAERFTSLKSELEKQIGEEDELNKRIAKNLSKIVITSEANV
jgi:type I restriction enzyme M protein